MTSAVTLCNAALSALHTTGRITAFDDTSEAARRCSERYASLRDSLLTSHSWNFATVRAELSQSATAPVYGFKYAYDLPTDCLRVLGVQPDYTGLDFKIEKRTLLFDESSLKILYLQRITAEDDMPIYFQEALIAKIAVDLAYAVTGDMNQVQLAEARYDKQLRHAKAMDGQEGIITPRDNSSWMAAHRGGVIDAADLNYTIAS